MIKKYKQIDRIWRQYEKVFIPYWRQLYLLDMKRVNEKIKDNPNNIYVIDQLIEPNYKGVEMALKKTYSVVGAHFAELVFKDIMDKYAKKATQISYFDKLLSDYVGEFGGDKLKTISETSLNEALKIVKTSLADGVALGQSIDTIASQIESIFKGQGYKNSLYMATRVARTEIIGASNRGQLIGAQNTGLEMNKQWVSRIDSATRTFAKSSFDHAGAHGETVGLYDMFKRTGENMQHPGDINASVGNIVNCRCTMIFRPAKKYGW